MKLKKITETILKQAGYTSSTIQINDDCKGIISCPMEGNSENYIVFLHGAGNDHSYPFFALLPTVALTRANFVFIDLPGHGNNSGIEFNESNIMSYMAGLSKLLSSIGYSKLSFIAHSIGSVSFLRNHRLFKDHTYRLVAISPPQKRSQQAGNIDILKILVSESLSILFPSVWKQSLNWGRAVIPAVGSYNRNSFPINPQRPKTFYRLCESYINSTDIIARLSEVESPTLIISANLDYIAPKINAVELEKIGRNHKQVTYGLENHFSILFNTSCHDNIKNFISQD